MKHHFFIISIILNISFSIFSAAKISLEKEHGRLTKQNDLNKRFFKAIKSGEILEVKKLISEGADVNYDEFGESPLSKAIYHKHIDIIRLLIFLGANVDSKKVQEYFDCALLNAEYDGENNKNMIRLLITTTKIIDASSQRGSRYLNFFSNLRGTPEIQKFYEEISELLINNGADPNYKDKDEISALIHSINRGKTKIVKLLLKSGAEFDDPKLYYTLIVNCIRSELDNMEKVYKQIQLGRYGNNVEIIELLKNEPGRRQASRILEENLNRWYLNNDLIFIVIGYLATVNPCEILKDIYNAKLNKLQQELGNISQLRVSNLSNVSPKDIILQFLSGTDII